MDPVAIAILGGIAPAVAIPGIETVTALESLDLAIIPLFLLMGSLASASGLAADLYRLANAFLGQRRGGLAAPCGQETSPAPTGWPQSGASGRYGSTAG